MKKGFTLFVLVAVVLALAAPLLAHHGTSVYDTKNPVTVSGTVTTTSGASIVCMAPVLVSFHTTRAPLPARRNSITSAL